MSHEIPSSTRSANSHLTEGIVCIADTASGGGLKGWVRHRLDLGPLRGSHRPCSGQVRGGRMRELAYEPSSQVKPVMDLFVVWSQGSSRSESFCELELMRRRLRQRVDRNIHGLVRHRISGGGRAAWVRDAAYVDGSLYGSPLLVSVMIDGDSSCNLEPII